MGIGIALQIVGLATAVASHQLQARDTPGCGKTHDDHDGTFLRSIQSGDMQRNYSIHLPPKYSPEDNHPVILGFHGSSSIGAFFEADTRFSDAADKTMNGVIMVYPDGLGGAWAGASYSEATVPQDLKFVSDILDDLRDEYCVDNDKIFATGMSIGGGFVNTIACNETVGGQFAGFAPVAGAYYTDNDENYEKCKPTKGKYLLELHGLKDESVPYEGGEASGGEVPDVHDWVERWVDRLDCDRKTSFEEDAFQDKDYGWRIWYCEDEGRIAHVPMKGRNHSWPADWPNFSQPISNDKEAPFDSAELILNWFLEPRWQDRYWAPWRNSTERPSSPSDTASAPAETGATETETTTGSGDPAESTTSSADEPEPSTAWAMRADLGLLLCLVMVVHAVLSI